MLEAIIKKFKNLNPIHLVYDYYIKSFLYIFSLLILCYAKTFI